MKNHYIGLENELITFKSPDYMNDDGSDPDRWTHVHYNANNLYALKEQFNRTHDISETAFRTDSGHGFYIDGGEIEILTPPIIINQGFATRLTDMLMIGRDKVIQATPDLQHTGFSMHWNLSYDAGDLPRSLFFNGVYVPFHLFCSTPLSCGVAIREKSNRYELLGDSLTKESQIRSAALMLGAYQRTVEANGRFPFSIFDQDIGEPIRGKTKLLLANGRYSDVVYRDDESREHVCQAQQMLEAFYDGIRPAVKVLGTASEVKELERYISGDDKLEFDDFKYFEHLDEKQLKEGGIYLCSEESKQVLKKSQGHSIPLEGKLFGKIHAMPDENELEILSRSWKNVILSDNKGNRIRLDSLPDIYEYARQRVNRVKKSQLEEPQINSHDIKINPQEKMRIEYDYFRDNSFERPPMPSGNKAFWNAFNLNISRIKPFSELGKIWLLGMGIALPASLGMILTEKLIEKSNYRAIITRDVSRDIIITNNVVPMVNQEVEPNE